MVLTRCCCKARAVNLHRVLNNCKTNYTVPTYHCANVKSIFLSQKKQQFSTSLLFSSENKSERNLDVFLQPDVSTNSGSNNAPIDNLDTMGSDPLLNSSSTIESFADYGLGGYQLPSHWLQNVLETLHCDYGLEWIPAIALLTVSLRTLALPAYIKMQQFSVRSANTMPEQMRLQFESVAEVNPIKKKRKAMEYMEFMRENNVNPIKNLLYMAPNGITFISFYWALKGMAKVKLPSLLVGGLSWFTDLTVADPYYILPVLSCTTLHLMIRFGGASSEVGAASPNPTLNKFILYSPFIMIPVFAFQPSALFIFWLTSNMYSAALIVLFKAPAVRKYFDIPDRDKSIDLGELNKKYNIKSMVEKVNEQKANEQAAREKMQNHFEMLKKYSKKKKDSSKES